MRRKAHNFIIFFLFSFLFLACGGTADNANVNNSVDTTIDNSIQSFEDCVRAGYPIKKSIPGQCETNDGRVFVNQIPARDEEIEDTGDSPDPSQVDEESANSEEETQQEEPINETEDTVSTNTITGASVTINDGFDPPEVTISAGESVTWTNVHENRASKVSSPLGKFFSTRMLQGESFSHTFEKPGKYPYIDAAQKTRRGTIIVN